MCWEKNMLLNEKMKLLKGEIIKKKKKNQFNISGHFL